jgi:hypothetical protein
LVQGDATAQPDSIASQLRDAFLVTEIRYRESGESMPVRADSIFD